MHKVNYGGATTTTFSISDAAGTDTNTLGTSSTTDSDYAVSVFDIVTSSSAQKYLKFSVASSRKLLIMSMAVVN